MLNNLYNKIHGQSSSGHSQNSLTARIALGLEGDNKYFDPQPLLTYLKTLRPAEIPQLSDAIAFMKGGTKTTGTYLKKVDKGGRTYGYLNFVKANGTPGCKIILECNMDKLVDDYIDGKITIDFTLEELVEEALNL